jgi:hypothetical protein
VPDDAPGFVIVQSNACKMIGFGMDKQEHVN